LLLSTVPSTPQKPGVFSWIVTVVPAPLEEELLLELLLDEELELLVELELLLDDEELDELDDELLLELLEVPSPAQVGAAKLPSWLPWKPKPVLWPGASACQPQQLVNW
jgi:hypothetical protein